MNTNRRSPIWKMEKNELEAIVKSASSLGHVLKIFGIEPKGGNYETLKSRLRSDMIDYSHISVGVGHNKGKVFKKPLKPIADVLVKNSSYSRQSLKKRLLSDGFLKNNCSICGLEPSWNNNQLVMILDHVNGISNDNRLENLRLVCPNCNSQLPTHCGKHKKWKVKNCSICGKEVSKTSNFCKTCRSHCYSNHIDLPSAEILQSELQKSSFEEVAKKYQISSNGLRKRCRKLGIPHTAKDYNGFRFSKNYCVDCGKILTSKRQQRCSKCFRSLKNYKEPPAREVLELDLESMNVFQISKKYETTNHTVKRWIKKYNLGM